jgi:hypothetical protein
MSSSSLTPKGKIVKIYSKVEAYKAGKVIPELQ